GHFGSHSTEVDQRNSGRTRNSMPTDIFKAARSPKTGVFGQAQTKRSCHLYDGLVATATGRNWP
ncbi:hypothetical protein, partial [Accumulibacter sp.]|uniref:hypothetical protein n=1 Tax=Accumulibacter sp. TaxID=2053492 RepID=UPI002618FD8A